MAKKKTIEKSSNVDEVGIKIQDIKLITSSIAPTDELLGIRDPHLFDFTYTVSTGISPQTNLVQDLILVAIVHATVKEKYSGNNDKVGEFRAACAFILTDSSVVKILKSGHVVIPEPVLWTMISVSLSTARGMMAADFRGTILERAIFPIVDPTDQVKKILELQAANEASEK